MGYRGPSGISLLFLLCLVLAVVFFTGKIPAGAGQAGAGAFVQAAFSANR
jgi:Sec-independent protein translocase protein TatA